MRTINNEVIATPEMYHREHLRRCAQCARGPLCVEGRQLWADNGFQPAEIPRSEIGSLASPVADYEKVARQLLGTLQQKGFVDDEIFENPAFDDSFVVALVKAALESTAKSALKERDDLLAFFGATLKPDGTLSIDMRKYHAAHLCKEHEFQPWKRADIEERCALCLQAAAKSAREDERARIVELCRARWATITSKRKAAQSRGDDKQVAYFDGKETGIAEITAAIAADQLDAGELKEKNHGR